MNEEENIVLGNCCFTCINGKITGDYRSHYYKGEKPLWCDKHEIKVLVFVIIMNLKIMERLFLLV